MKVAGSLSMKSFVDRYVSDGFWDGVCWVDVDPPSEGGGAPLDVPTPPSGTDPAAELAALRAELAAKEKALANARLVERRYKSLEAIVGDTNPEKLQELRDAEIKLKQQQESMDKLLLEAKNSVKTEFEQQLEELRKQNTTLTTAQKQTEMTFDLFKEFNDAEGDPKKFNGFIKLSEGLFQRTESGQIQVKDAAGKLVTTKDEDGNLRPARPAEFMRLLISGKLDGEFIIPDSEFLKSSFAAYNKAMGSGLPSGNGSPLVKNPADMSQSQLGAAIFGG